MSLPNPNPNLAPGYRFHPTDTELISYYLNRKNNNELIEFDPITELDLYKYAPWQLPKLSGLKIRNEKQWFFFNCLDRKYDGSRRSNRATNEGFWKSTGKDRPIYEENEGKSVLGMKKILVFHVGRAPKGVRTDWVMHEYRGVDEAKRIKDNGVSYVLCRIFQKCAIGREKGDLCGAHYIKEESEEAHDSSESDSNGLMHSDNIIQKTDIKCNLAPGFRFRPTDEELVGYYLKRKILGLPLKVDAIPEVNIYKWAPWDLPSLSRISLTVPNMEGYYFSALDRKYAQNRSIINNRATAEGYWKSTGNDCPVHSHIAAKKIGMKKFLVFHTGRAPRSQRTDWVMHEYRLEEDEQNTMMSGKGSSFVVCKIFQKNNYSEQKGRPRSVGPINEELNETIHEMPPGEVLDAPNVNTVDAARNVSTADAAPNVSIAVAAPNVSIADIAPNISIIDAAPNVRIADIAPNVSIIDAAPNVSISDDAPNVIVVDAAQTKNYVHTSDGFEQGKPDKLYKVGNQVEIAYMRQQIPVAWYTANVIKEHNERVLLVEYESLKTKDNTVLSELVSIQYIRPHPPTREVGKFEVLAEVEAFYNGGWWPGVVAEVKDNLKYNVKFMHLEEEIEFSHKELRLLYDWVDGKWIQASQDKSTESQNLGDSQTVHARWHSSNINHKRKFSDSSTHSSGSRNEITCYFTDTTADYENDNSDITINRSQHEIKRPLTKAKLEEKIEEQFSGEINDELVLRLSLQGDKGSKLNSEGEMRREKCMPRIIQPSVEGGSIETQEDYKVVDLSVERPLTGQCGTSSDNSSEAQGLSNAMGSSSDASLVESSTSSIKPRLNKLSLNQTPWPFEKCSHLWDSIENMEVFYTMPQNPHFRPLEQYSEDFREGMAIGLMLTFSNVVSSIDKLDITDAFHKFDPVLKSLVHLEENGFDVQCLRARIVELLKTNDNQERLVDVISHLENLLGSNEVNFKVKIEAVEKDPEEKSDISQ